MTNERAIEILDPEHREQYDSIETVNEACRIGMNAIRRVQELEAENAGLHKALNDIKVFGLEMKSGSIDMTVGSDTFNYITAMLVQMLEQNNAKNFLTTAIEVGNQKYSVTVQKNGGKTPNEELSELKTENAALKERLEKAVELPCKVGDIVYYLQTYCDYKGETVKHCSKRERPIMCECDEVAHRWSSKYWIYVIREKLFELRDLTRIGKTLFLYREEAEAKIAELRRRCNEKH